MTVTVTTHQRSVLGRVVRATLTDPWFITSEDLGNRGACEHLIRKMLIAAETVTGPRGGTTYLYRATADGFYRAGYKMNESQTGWVKS